MAIQIDRRVLQRLVGQAYLSYAVKAFGTSAQDIMNLLIDSIREFFKIFPPDQINTRFVIVAGFGPLPTPATPAIPADATPIAEGLRLELMSTYRLSVRAANTAYVVVRDSGKFDLYRCEDDTHLEALSGGTIAFVNCNNVDQFVIDGTELTLEQLIPGAPSQFAVPMVRDLDEALEHYRERAVHATCRILEAVWHEGKAGPRLVFSNKPEATMRSSLALFLQARLVDASVREEHLTDETKPVDIVVNWYGAKLRALIEVKWLGKALTAKSDGTNFTEFREPRVQEGADQLIDYMDREVSSDPTMELRGYVAVFDGRRQGVKRTDQKLSAQNATHYRDLAPKLTRDYSKDREDFAPIVRYFMEPRSSHFLDPH
jgi:hypothetical protein